MSKESLYIFKRILNTIKENNLTIHIAEKLPENCTGAFTLKVDAQRRRKIAANHTCTHLLDRALREILGSHVEQKGSFVCDKNFRFDFSHFEKLSEEQIAAVEHRVNELIRENYSLEEKRDATMDEAAAMGAIALFGEKYGDRVRVVKFGPSVEISVVVVVLPSEPVTATISQGQNSKKSSTSLVTIAPAFSAACNSGL